MQGTTAILELNDIQSGVLRPRQTPYVATYLLLRIDNPADGRAMLKRLTPLVASAADVTSPAGDAWVMVALSYRGLKALGVPQASLESFSPEFQQGMVARAEEIGDTGENHPDHWEKPLGSSEVHLAIAVTAPDRTRLEQVLSRAKQSYQELSGVTVIYRQDCAQLPTGREHFGFRDGIGQPAIEGSGLTGSNPQEAPLKAGEFVLGYPDESGRLSPMPQPEVLGRNGSYVAFRKLHQDVPAFRRYLAAHSTSAEQEEWVAAKMVGRWRSGAPLALSPEHDDPELGADLKRNNDFLYYDDDPKGFKCPPGSHIRRMNPRDHFKHEAVQVNRHRLIRRGMSYGPLLPEGALEDDGVDRGIIFIFVGASLERQFEFVESEWVNQGIFIGATNEKDPLNGPNDGTGVLTIPKQPIRQRLIGLPQFVTTRGGEYLFLPGLRALHWLAEETP
ncbi:peroxidase [Reticulibacter mediterranei]|uniref:Peroxidase n=1 Tax=Reticulibacter mediterranei TaxID=2778369 RepID=A0A8J3NA32_9CHLR|nr:Dyp-type peroxidase [Reticulibacter mediterranei]GHO99962.1 peroxidase [Reticulibacter mediterranei]